MLQISNHAIERYAQRFMDFTELESESLTHHQYCAIRNLLIDRFGHVVLPTCILNYKPWDARIIIVDDVLVTITKQ